jgi:DNA-binding transcriptional ArsR family regulator
MDDVREISDSRVLAAMAHPLRRRMLSLLHVDGPMTVGMLATRTDQAVGNVSHHLRALASTGLIEEVPELARDRRERWWRRTTDSIRWSSNDFTDDPVDETIAGAAESINVDYQAAMVRQWISAGQEFKERWPHGPFSSDAWMRLTDAELGELGDELTAVIQRWGRRTVPDDGAERETVFVIARGAPAQP